MANFVTIRCDQGQLVEWLNFLATSEMYNPRFKIE